MYHRTRMFRAQAAVSACTLLWLMPACSPQPVENADGSAAQTDPGLLDLIDQINAGLNQGGGLVAGETAEGGEGGGSADAGDGDSTSGDAAGGGDSADGGNSSGNASSIGGEGGEQAGGAKLLLSPTSLDFGPETTQLELLIDTDASQVQASTSVSWMSITIDPPGEDGTRTARVTADRASLSEGVYEGALTVTAGTASQTVLARVEVPPGDDVDPPNPTDPTDPGGDPPPPPPQKPPGDSGGPYGFWTAPQLTGVGGDEIMGVAINAAALVGRSTGSAGAAIQGFHWSQSTGRNVIGDLVGGANYNHPYGISGNAVWAVGQSSSSAGFEAYRFSLATGSLPLGDFVGGAFHSCAYAASFDGSVVVGYGTTAAGPHAFRWTAAGGMQSLPLASGASASIATDVSADGSVIVGIMMKDSGVEAFRWQEAVGTQLIGSLPGGTWSRATAVSGDGTAIVGMSDSPDGVLAFRWTASGGMQSLGDLAAGIVFSAAYKVSNDGTVVTGATSSINGYETFLWDTHYGMRSLKTTLWTKGIDMTGWKLKNPRGVSPDGDWFYGSGTAPDQSPISWLMQLP